MKNRILILLMLCPALSIAQNNRVLYEMFTDTDCPHCPVENHYIDSMAMANPSKMLVLRYQMAVLGSSDVMHIDDSAEINWRYFHYYGDFHAIAWAVPRGKADGLKILMNIPEEFTQYHLDSLYNLPKPFMVDVAVQFTPDFDSMHYKVIIKSLVNQQFQPGKLRLRIVIAEDSVGFPYAPGTNGESVFQHVVRKFIPDTSGFSLPSVWSAGQKDSIEGRCLVPSYLFSLNRISLLAFVQNDSSKYIIQTGEAKAAGPSSYATIDAVNSLNFSPVTCADTLSNVNVRVKNSGTLQLSSFDLAFRMDNKPEQVRHYSCNLNPGSCGDFLLYGIPDSTGIHTLSVRIASPNAHLLSPRFGYMFNVSKSFRVSKQASPLPVMETFSGSSFPPADWTVHSVQKFHLGWKRNFYPFVRNSAFLQIYKKIPDGIANELILPLLDFSGLSQCFMSFWVTNAWDDLGANYDSLKVFISTDCGTIWKKVYDKSGHEIGKQECTSIEYTPQADSLWIKDTVDLSAYIGNQKVFIKFTGTSGGGNNLYLTNINVGDYLGMEQFSPEYGVQVYPNPAHESVTIISPEGMPAEIRIFDGTGRKLRSLKQNPEGHCTISLSGFSPGVYFVRISLNGMSRCFPLILNR